jgi:ribosomal protein L37AE/L43A
VTVDDTYQRLQALIALMSPKQLDALEQSIRERRGLPTGPEPSAKAPLTAPPQVSGTIQTIEAAFQAQLSCPHCQSKKLQKWGKAHELQRYRCRGCKRTFNALTGTPLAQLHKRELWLPHGQALIDGLSQRPDRRQPTNRIPLAPSFLEGSQGIESQEASRHCRS